MPETFVDRIQSATAGWFVPMHDPATGRENNHDFSAVYSPCAEGRVVDCARNATTTRGGLSDQIGTGTGTLAVALGGASGNRLLAAGTARVTEFAGGNGVADVTVGARSGTNGMGVNGINRGDTTLGLGGSWPTIRRRCRA